MEIGVFQRWRWEAKVLQAAEHERKDANSVSTVQIEETHNSAKKTNLFKKTIQVNSNGSCNMKDLIDKVMITLQQEKYVKLLAKNNSVTKCISVLEIIKRKINNELSNLDSKKPAEGHLNEHINLFSQVNEKDITKKDAVMEIYLSFV